MVTFIIIATLMNVNFYISWTIICTIKMEELNAVNEHGLILPEAPQPVNYQREMEGQSTLKIFLDGKKRLQSVAAKLKKEKELEAAKFERSIDQPTDRWIDRC